MGIDIDVFARLLKLALQLVRLNGLAVLAAALAMRGLRSDISLSNDFFQRRGW